MCPFVSKIIDESVRMMTPLLKLAGVEEKKMSPFYKRFTSSKDLLDAYIIYLPKQSHMMVWMVQLKWENPMKAITATNNKLRKKTST